MFNNQPFRLGEASALGRKKEPIILGLITLALLIFILLTWIGMILFTLIKQWKRKRYLRSCYRRRKKKESRKSPKE